MVAELDNKRLHGELLMLRSDTDAAKADRDSAKAGAERYQKEMLKEQKEASEALAELEKLKKKLVRPYHTKNLRCHARHCDEHWCLAPSEEPLCGREAVVTCFAHFVCAGRRGGQS
jgi:hypothetical protein